VRRLAACLLLALAPATAQDPPPPTPRAYLESVLAAERPTHRFRETPLGDVIRALQESVWLNVVLDPAVDRTRPITFQADGTRPFGECLDALLAPHGVGFTIWCDVLYLHPRGQTLPPEPATTLPGALPAYTAHHAVVPFREALSALADLSGLRFEVTPVAAERARTATVSLRVRNLALHHLVTLLAHQVGLRWTLDEGVVWVHADGEDLPAVRAEVLKQQDAARLTATFDATRLDDVASLIQALSGVEVRLGPGVARDLPITLRVTDASVAQTLDALVKDRGLAWRRQGTSVVVVKP
jgi:hypothetical protein